MNIETLAEKELSSVLEEKQHRLNARLQIWQLLIALTTGFGIASVQAGNISYVIILYPFLAMCVARYAGHSEHVLDRIKFYLLSIEKDNNFEGYETFNKNHPFKHGSRGGHKKALLQAVLITQSSALAVIIWKIGISWPEMVVYWLVGIVFMMTFATILATIRFLSD